MICFFYKFSSRDRYVMKILDLRSRKVPIEQNTANKISLEDYSIHSQPAILL